MDQFRGVLQYCMVFLPESCSIGFSFTTERLIDPDFRSCCLRASARAVTYRTDGANSFSWCGRKRRDVLAGIVGYQI